MIDMGMAEHDGINGGGIKRKGFAVTLLIIPPALNKAAVEQNPLPRCFNQMAGTGHFPGCAMECDFNLQSPSIVSNTRSTAS